MTTLSDGLASVNVGGDLPAPIIINHIASPLPASPFSCEAGAHMALGFSDEPASRRAAKRAFRRIVKRSGLPTVRVAGAGLVVETAALVAWLRNHGKALPTTLSKSPSPRDDADRALAAAGFVRGGAR
jgi:hypothetical protein